MTHTVIDTPDLTEAQRADLITVADKDPRPGLVNGNRLRWLAAKGLVTLERRGTGRGVWTAATITELGLVALGRADAVVPVLDEAEREADAQDEPMTVDQALTELGHHHDVFQLEKEALVRARIAELERELTHLQERTAKLVAALRRQRDGSGLALSISVARAVQLLADAAGVEITDPTIGEPEPAQVTGQEHDGSTARETLARLGVSAIRLIVGQETQVREGGVYATRGPAGTNPTRVLGTLVNTAAGERLLTDSATTWPPVVAVSLIPAYVEAVRAAGCPAPQRRRALLAAVIRERGQVR